MGKRMPETCWAVFERQAINLRDWCIWLVDLFECMIMHGLTNSWFKRICVFYRSLFSILYISLVLMFVSHRHEPIILKLITLSYHRKRTLSFGVPGQMFAKSKLQQTASFIELKPLNVYHSTHTCILLTALIFRKCYVDKAFVTNVSYSAGHLTSIP